MKTLLCWLLGPQVPTRYEGWPFELRCLRCGRQVWFSGGYFVHAAYDLIPRCTGNEHWSSNS
jgi:hypothetical protein